MGQESGRTELGSCGPRSLLGLQSSQGQIGAEDSASRLTLRLLAGLRNLQDQLVGICSGLLHTMATSYPQVSHPGHSKRELPKWTLQSFYNLTSEVLSHHSCCIRVVRSKSTVSAPARGHEHQKAGTIGGHLRGCLTHWLGIWILELKC